MRAIEEICKLHHAREVAPQKTTKNANCCGRAQDGLRRARQAGSSNYVLDAVIPRSKFAQALRRVLQIGKSRDCKSEIFFMLETHLHPLVFNSIRGTVRSFQRG